MNETHSSINSGPTDLECWTSALLQARQTVLPKRLVEPGPHAEQLQSILGAAASAPDHGRITPWRFVHVPVERRGCLATAFAFALLERDYKASEEQLAQAKEKAYRAPLLMLVVVDGERGDSDVDFNERVLSTGCAVQNILLMATALGFGSALTSGKALKSQALRSLFGLQQSEHALCFISIGTESSRKPPRNRPRLADYVTSLSTP